MRPLSLLTLAIVAGCTTTPEGAPDVISTTALACKDLAASIRATDASVKANVLKGKAADDVITALGAAQAQCHSALNTIKAAQPAASGATK